VPSLLTMAVICFLPWTCRRSHSLWRAIQVYDKQPSENAVPSQKKVSMLDVLAFIGPALTLFVLMVFVAVTSGGQWHNGWPFMAGLRDAVPRLFLIYFVYRATSSASATILTPLLSISRLLAADQSEIISITRIKDEGPAMYHERRNAFALDICTSIGIVWAGHLVSDQSPIVLAMASGCTLLATEYNTVPLRLFNYTSFRGFVLVPFVCVAYNGLNIVLSRLLVYFLWDYLGNSKTDTDSPAGTTSSWGVGKMFEDVDAIQSFLLLSSAVYGISAWFTCALVALAYRYDLDQEGHSTLSDEETDEVIALSSLPIDESGRSPILLKRAALDPSRIRPQQLPTYYAAFYTMIAIQLIGIAVDVLTGWQPGTYFPTREDQLPTKENPFSASVWPLIAYPFVVIAMIISVRRQPDRTIRSLWSYNERWNPENKTSVKSTDEEPSRAEVQLLELGKRSGE
jgi:hypothetical protein